MTMKNKFIDYRLTNAYYNGSVVQEEKMTDLNEIRKTMFKYHKLDTSYLPRASREIGIGYNSLYTIIVKRPENGANYSTGSKIVEWWYREGKDIRPVKKVKK